MKIKYKIAQEVLKIYIDELFACCVQFHPFHLALSRESAHSYKVLQRFQRSPNEKNY